MARAQASPGLIPEEAAAEITASAPMQVILAVRYDVHQRENASLPLLTNLLCIPSLAFIWPTG